MSSAPVAWARRSVAGHGGEDTWLDLSEVGTHEDVTGLGDHGPTQVGRHVVQPGRRRHPPGRAVRSRPLSAQPPVDPDVLVEPVVAVRRGHPLGLAPRQQGVDERMVVAVGLQPPGTGVGHVDPDASQQRADVVGPPQVDAPARRGVAQHGGVAGGPLDVGVGRRPRPGPDRCGDDALGLDAVDGQAVGGQLHAEQLGRRLRAGGRGHPPGQGVGQGELAGGDDERQLRPSPEAAGRRRPRRRQSTPAAGAHRHRGDPRARRGRGPARTGRAGGGAGWCRGRGRAPRPTPWPGRRATRRTAAGGRPRRSQHVARRTPARTSAAGVAGDHHTQRGRRSSSSRGNAAASRSSKRLVRPGRATTSPPCGAIATPTWSPRRTRAALRSGIRRSGHDPGSAVGDGDAERVTGMVLHPGSGLTTRPREAT